MSSSKRQRCKNGAPLEFVRSLCVAGVPSKPECIIWPYGHSSTGRAVVRYGDESVLVARLILLKQLGKWPSVARHSCDNPGCVNPAHIQPGTQADNIQDMWERGRAHVKPRKHSDELVAALKAEYVPYSRTHGSLQLAGKHGLTDREVRTLLKR